MIELEDLGSGEQILMDAEHITNMRTGAAGALGAKYLAKKNVETVAILGTGRIAQALARCADAALSPTLMRATSRTPEKRSAFQAEVCKDLCCNLDLVADVESCIDGADAIFASVPTATPILSAVEPNVHLSVMGGDGRTTQLEPELLTQHFVVPDHAKQVLKSGEFLGLDTLGKTAQWITGGYGEILTIGHAAAGLLEQQRGQGCIAYFSGMAIQDVHAASVAWSRLRQNM